jgi:hypothetical protein
MIGRVGLGTGLLAVLVPAAAADPAAEPRSGARAEAVSGTETDWLGGQWVDLPVAGGPWVLSVDALLTLEQPTGDLAFAVGELQYEIDIGRTWLPRALAGRPVVLFAGQQGRERVDADGQAFVRFVGAGLASRSSPGTPGFGVRPGSDAARSHWRLALGAIVEEREVSAEVALGGQAGIRLCAPRPGRPSLELEIEIDGVVADGRLLADVAAGPRVRLPASDGHSADFFLHYRRDRHPLGLGEDLWTLGLAYGDDPSRDRDPIERPAADPPGVDGLLGLGAGEGRRAGRLLSRLLSPPLGGDSRLTFLVDGNILTAEDTGELYYLYHLGVERPLGTRWAGVYFFHRSNHQLAEPGERITSLNALELGLETAEWWRPGKRRPRGRARLDAMARAGLLIDSSLGEDDGWHVRGGLRWTLGGLERAQPYVLVEAEAGGVDRQSYAVGVAPAPALDLQLEYRSDDQYFGRDRTAWLLTAQHGF